MTFHVFSQWRSQKRNAAVAMMTVAATTAGVLTGCGQSDPPAPAKGGDHDHGDHAGHDHGAGGADHKADEGHADEVVLTPEAVRTHGVRIQKAAKRQLVAQISAAARVSFNVEHMAHVSVALNGRISELKVRIGDTVKKDDVLLVVESAELGEAQSDYLQKRTAAEILKPAIELAKSSHERAQQLFDEKQGITLTEVQKRLGELKAAEGALKSAEAAIVGAERRLQLLGMPPAAIAALARSGELNPKHIVKGPIDGTVIARSVTLGEHVSPETESLVTLADTSTVWLLADVPELSLHLIAKDAKAELIIPALPNETFSGTVAYIEPELNTTTRTARVRIEVSNSSGKLRPGMFASANIAASGAAEPVVAVPEDAIQTVEGQPSVFVPVPDEKNTFARREVTIGKAIDGYVPVSSGLKEGEPYVSSGSFLLKADLGKASGTHEH